MSNPDSGEVVSSSKRSIPIFNNVWTIGILTGIASTIIYNSIDTSISNLPKWLNTYTNELALNSFKTDVLTGVSTFQYWVYKAVPLLVGGLAGIYSGRIFPRLNIVYSTIATLILFLVLSSPLLFYLAISQVGYNNYLIYKETTICSNLDYNQEKILTQRMLSSKSFSEADKYVREYNCPYRFIPLK